MYQNPFNVPNNRQNNMNQSRMPMQPPNNFGAMPPGMISPYMNPQLQQLYMQQAAQAAALLLHQDQYLSGDSGSNSGSASRSRSRSRSRSHRRRRRASSPQDQKIDDENHRTVRSRSRSRERRRDAEKAKKRKARNNNRRSKSVSGSGGESQSRSHSRSRSRSRSRDKDDTSRRKRRDRHRRKRSSRSRRKDDSPASRRRTLQNQNAFNPLMNPLVPLGAGGPVGAVDPRMGARSWGMNFGGEGNRGGSQASGAASGNAAGVHPGGPMMGAFFAQQQNMLNRGGARGPMLPRGMPGMPGIHPRAMDAATRVFLQQQLLQQRIMAARMQPNGPGGFPMQQFHPYQQQQHGHRQNRGANRDGQAGQTHHPAGWYPFDNKYSRKRYSLRSASAQERGKEIRSGEDVQEKVDLTVDWIRYQFPESHQVELFETVVDLFLNLVAMGFADLPSDILAKTSQTPLQRIDVQLIRVNLEHALERFSGDTHVQMIGLFADAHHDFLPKLLSQRNPVENFSSLLVWFQNPLNGVEAHFLFKLLTFPVFLDYIDDASVKRDFQDHDETSNRTRRDVLNDKVRGSIDRFLPEHREVLRDMFGA